MTSRFVNLSLLILTVALLGSGVILLTTARPEDAWVFALHRYVGAALLLLLIPKTRIVFRSLARRWKRGTIHEPATLAGVGLAGFLLLSLAFALAWTLDRLPFYVNFGLYATPLGLHWYVAFLLVPLFAWHAWKRWVPIGLTSRPRIALPARPGISRRTALGALGVGIISLLGLNALDQLAGATDWARRFTGSRLVDSFQGNRLPVTNSDGPPEISISSWRLSISGRVSTPLALTYEQLLSVPATNSQATLDCTLGWASNQNWRGIRISDLLERAGATHDARQVTCRATTGAVAVLSMEEARLALVATHIGTEVLDGDHGFPARLVAPTRRGYHWIKWMSELVVS